MHVCHVAVCLWDHISGEVPRASVEAPWIPASLVPGSNPTARAARTGSSGAAARGAAVCKGGGGWHKALVADCLQGGGVSVLHDTCKKLEVHNNARTIVPCQTDASLTQAECAHCPPVLTVPRHMSHLHQRTSKPCGMKVLPLTYYY